MLISECRYSNTDVEFNFHSLSNGNLQFNAKAKNIDL